MGPTDHDRATDAGASGDADPGQGAVEVFTTADAPVADEWGPRPVLAASFGGPGPDPAMTAALLAGLGEGAVALPAYARVDGRPSSSLARRLGALLGDGLSVLVHLVEATAPARRMLLDAAARYWAWTLAIIPRVATTGGDLTVGDLTAELVAEGWNAVVVLP